MKDLYRRNNLKPCESDPVKIHNCEGGSEKDKEAAYTILLNENKKIEYDRVYKAVDSIGYIRAHFGLNKTSNWDQVYSDFVRSDKDQIVVKAESKSSYQKDSFDKEPAKNTRRYLPLAFTAIGIALGLLLISSTLVSKPKIDDPSETRLMHANRDIKVTLEADPDSQVLKSFDRYDDVRMIYERSKANWAVLDLGGYEGFVPRGQLNEGSGEEAYIKSCSILGASSRPENGTHFIPYSKGRYVLVVVNPSAVDAIVKLKDTLEKDIGFFYIRGGSTVTLENFPEETFRIFYAHGENYNANCERFLTKMQVMRERNFQTVYAGSRSQFSRTYTLRGGGDYEQIPWKYF
ncbi:hypothetical protein NBRC116493_08490 [Aurantivibrio infirmus]